jgi:hypothetical protein
MKRTIWLRSGLWLGAVLVAVVYADAAFMLAPRLGLPPRRDPVSQAFGWDAAARDVQGSVRAAMTARRGDASPGHVWVAADRYQEAAQLHWALSRTPLDTVGVFSLNIGGRTNQYALWPVFRQVARKGDSMVLILDESEVEPGQIVELAPYFVRIDEGPPVARTAYGLMLGRQRAWLLREWLGGWPGYSTSSIPDSR